jgi:hypothetical protein
VAYTALELVLRCIVTKMVGTWFVKMEARCGEEDVLSPWREPSESDQQLMIASDDSPKFSKSIR